jgi:AcrR family transcriptional regulator
MPKAFSEQEKQHIRAQLLEAGREQFATYGLRKTNVEELTRAVGISKGAFYSFYESKEALFMEVTEEAEQQFRRKMLAAVEEPGPTPRARLSAVLKLAFRMWKTIPVLQLFTQNDYNWLSRRIPAASLEAHLQADQVFFEDLLAHCRASGIPVTIPAEELGALLYPLFLTSLHEDDFGKNALSAGLDTLIELVAAYCLGEVETSPFSTTAQTQSE